jgi:hypothetical protein
MNRILLACLLLTSTLMQNMGFAVAQTTLTLYAVADNHSDSKYPRSAYGTRPVLYVGNSYDHAQKIWGSERIYIRFDVSAIPKDHIVLRATLRLWQYYAPALEQRYEVHRVLGDWDAKTENWLNQPAWAEAKTSETTAPPRTEVPVEWDITSDVKAWCSGEARNYGIMIKAVEEKHVRDASSGFWSREYPVEDWKPRLTIILGGNPTLTYAVEVRATGLPINVTSPILVDGKPYGTVSSDSALWIVFDKETIHTVSVSDLVATSESIRYRCTVNKIQVSTDASYVFTYTTEYLVVFSTHPSEMFQAPATGWYPQGIVLVVNRTGPEFVDTAPGTRLAFSGWSENQIPACPCLRNIVVNKPMVIDGRYTTEYYLNVTSPIGETQGSGWYRNGSIARFAVETSRMVTPGLLGQLGLKRSFVRWVGSDNLLEPTGEPVGSIVMTGPANVKAVWQDDWASMFANPITLLIIAATLVAAIIISRRLRDRSLPAPGGDDQRSPGG